MIPVSKISVSVDCSHASERDSFSSSSSSSSRCCSRSSYSCFRRSTISSVSRNRSPLARRPVPSGSGSGDTALHQNPHKTGMGPSAAGKASPCFPAYPLPPDPIPVLHGPEPFSISVRSFHMPGTDHPFCCFLSGKTLRRLLKALHIILI